MAQITEEQKATLSALAKGYTTVNHPTPILETPEDYGMGYKDVKFKAQDGVELAAWFIPAKNSNKLIICNHPATFNRYGFPGHKEPWSNFQDVEVKFGNVYKALHDAGYNVLTYDLRNHGESGDAEANIWGQGFNSEYKDVLAAFDYLKSQDNLQNMSVGLFNPCAGGNAAMTAMTKHPEYFKEVKAFVCAQPASINIMSKITLDNMGLGDYMTVFDEELEKNGGLKSSQMTPHNIAQNVKVPTFIIQNKDDVWTIPEDVQKTYDLIPGKDKKLFWIEEDNSKRFIGYNYLGEHPEMMLEWFNTYMK
ncbi:alpha/beta hydrolase family protein [Tenacibaculum aiptasiae]|uniref:alpha/beta hydrolase family protein n=1 Tax=Tenacibaculum aiptasiae TaxID=426481 RepID=UPI003B592FCC